MTSLYNPMPDREVTAYGSTATAGAYTAQGDDTWYRWRVRFPSGVYVPRMGVWNINVEWHESRYGSTLNNCPTYTSPYFGVQADGTTANPGTNPRLIFHFRSGQVAADGNSIENDFVIAQHDGSGNVMPLQYDHWYDVVAHYRWEPDSSGAFEWYVDGQLQYRNLGIKTMHVFCDGTSYPYTFGMYDYQRNDGAWPSGVDYKTMDIGPTAASVGWQRFGSVMWTAPTCTRLENRSSAICIRAIPVPGRAIAGRRTFCMNRRRSSPTACAVPRERSNPIERRCTINW